MYKHPNTHTLRTFGLAKYNSQHNYFALGLDKARSDCAMPKFPATKQRQNKQTDDDDEEYVDELEEEDEEDEDDTHKRKTKKSRRR